jgi:hypothetical protein
VDVGSLLLIVLAVRNDFYDCESAFNRHDKRKKLIFFYCLPLQIEHECFFLMASGNWMKSAGEVWKF